ncbi:MAG TPA: AarF/ABC1/UbiB kinase family protein [Myxococcota bacterium]|nr:AarF/ABC1/UbiB kinase family protein [Myxococcota bacterium]
MPPAPPSRGDGDDDGGAAGPSVRATLGTLLELPRGFRKRTLAALGAGARVGWHTLRRALPGAAPEGEGRPADAARDAAAERTALQLVETLGALKGLALKAGQMASYIHGALPPAAQRVLTRLQADTHPMAFAQIDAVVRAELGASADEVFEGFERTPFAAASIGQVHRALLRTAVDGGADVLRPVAVKVQYPGIEDVLHGDLRLFGGLLKLAFFATPGDGGAVAAELRDRILEECDYEREARHQALFRRLVHAEPLAGRVHADVPEVVAAASTRRILTSALVEGARDFYRFATESDQPARDRAAADIFATAFTCIFRHCVYNADPHPGNYLFRPDGTVVFLDFGCVRHFEAHVVDTWKACARAVLDGDRAAYRRGFTALGFVGSPRRFDWDAAWDVMQYLYAPFLATEPFTYTPEYVERSYDVIVWSNPNARRMGTPREFLFVNRLQWGLNSVFAHLRATGPWGELWRRALDEPTRPAALDAGAADRR